MSSVHVHLIVGKDEIAALLRFSYEDLRKRVEFYKKPRWYNLYGAPRFTDTGAVSITTRRYADNMNTGRHPGNTYRGRVLLSFDDHICGSQEPMMLNKPGEKLISGEPEKPPVDLWLVRYGMRLCVAL
jgi:hypothetical protein